MQARTNEAFASVDVRHWKTRGCKVMQGMKLLKLPKLCKP